MSGVGVVHLSLRIAHKRMSSGLRQVLGMVASLVALTLFAHFHRTSLEGPIIDAKAHRGLFSRGVGGIEPIKWSCALPRRCGGHRHWSEAHG